MTKTISETAVRIAKAGAVKMAGKYTFKPFPFTQVAGVVTKLEDGTRYKVNTYTGTCSCPFHLKEGYCKHLDWLKDELAWEAARITEWEATQV